MNNPEYDINDYTDNELFDLLDLTNPSDRILEAKILMMIQKYSELTTVSGRKLTKFFEDVYAHFFDLNEENKDEVNEDDENQDQTKEGFESTNPNPNPNSEKEPTMKEIMETLITALNKGNSLAADVTKGNTVVKATNLEYVKSNINPILKQTCKRICMFDSQYRDTTLYPNSGNYLINLSDPLYNVLTLRLHTINIPFTWYNVSKNYNYNYFTLTSTGSGFENVFQFKFGIEGGSYTMTQLTQSLQNAINTVASQNPDTNFGNTAIAFSQSTGKMKLTLDIGNIYTTNNYYLDFPTWSNPYDSSRNTTIPGFLGFIPPTTPYVESLSNIVLSKIYSNFGYAETTTKNIVNGFNNTIHTPNPPAYALFDYYAPPDASANNYFTIYNYDGTNGTTYPFDPSTYTVYDRIDVSFNINTFLLTPTRENITERLNVALQSNPSLDPSSNISQELFQNYDASGNYMYRYALNIILNRNTTATHKVAGMNQIVVFPPIDATYAYPIWTGPNSCFLFDPNNSLQQLNNVTSQVSVSPFWNIISSPNIRLKCTKFGYDNSYNNFITDISNGTYPSNEYLTVYTPPSSLSQVQNTTPTNSIINQALTYTVNAAIALNPRINPDFKQLMYFDPSKNHTVGSFNISTNYLSYDFYLDLSKSIFNQSWNFPATIDWSSNPYTEIIPVNQLTWTITNQNNTLSIHPQPTSGTVSLPDFYTNIDVCNNGLTPTEIIQQFNDISLNHWFSDASCQNPVDVTTYGINAINFNMNYSSVGSKQNTLNINTSPFIDISCITPGYNNKYTANIPNVGDISFNNYIGIANDYSRSTVNTALSTLSRPKNNINAIIYYDASYISSPQVAYDPSYAYTVGFFDISINYDISDYNLDFTDCSFLTNLGMPSIIYGTNANIDISFQVPSTLTYVDYFGQSFTLKGADPSSNINISIPATLQYQQPSTDFSMINIINNTLNPAIQDANNPVQFGVDWSNSNFYYEPSGGARSLGSVTITDSPEIQLSCNVSGYNTPNDISNANITILIDISDETTFPFTDYLGLLSDNSYEGSTVNSSIVSGFSQITNPAFTNNGTVLYYDDIPGNTNYKNTVGIFDFSIRYNVSDFYLELTNSIFHQEWGFPQTISGDSNIIIDVSSQIESGRTWSIITGVNDRITVRPNPNSGTTNVPPIDIIISSDSSKYASVIIGEFNDAILSASSTAAIYKIDLSGTYISYDPSGGTSSNQLIPITTNPQIQLLYNGLSGYDNSYNNIIIVIPNNDFYTYDSYIGTLQTGSYLSSAVNTSLFAGLNPESSVNIYYDTNSSTFIGDFSINIQYTGANYYLDLTNSIFCRDWSFNQTIDGSSGRVTVSTNISNVTMNDTYSILYTDAILLNTYPNTGAYIPDSNTKIEPFKDLSGSSSISIIDIINAYQNYVSDLSYQESFSSYGIINIDFSCNEYVNIPPFGSGTTISISFDMSINPITSADYTAVFTDSSEISPSWETNFNFTYISYTVLSSNTSLSHIYTPILDYSGVVTTQFYVQPYALTASDYTVKFNSIGSQFYSYHTSWSDIFNLKLANDTYNLSDNTQITSTQTYDPPYDYSGLVLFHYEVTPYSLTTDDFCVLFGDASGSSWSNYFDLNNQPYNLSLNEGQIQSDTSYNALIPEQHVIGISYNVSVDPINIQDYTVSFEDYSANLYDGYASSWRYFMGLDPSYNLDASNSYNSNTNTSTIDSSNVPLTLNTITINSTNNTFYLRPQSNIRGLSDISGINDITITLPYNLSNNTYTQPELFSLINSVIVSDWSAQNIDAPYSIPTNTLVLYTDPSTNIQYSQFQFNIGRSYTAKDYNLTFFDPSSAVLYNANIGGTCTVTPQIWGIAIGWQIGFHSSPIYYLNPSYANTPLNTLSPLTTNTQSMTLANSYTYDPSTNIVAITGDTVVDLYLYYNFFIVFDDGVMNRLNDGLVTVSDKDQNVDSSSYSNAAQSKRVLGNVTINNFTNSTNSNNLTQAQYYAASQKTIANTSTTSQYRPTQPTNLSDCFAVLPLKQQGLTIGQTYTDSGGSLQDNNRVYFGPVNVRQANIQLVSDRGEIVDLNGANWSFCMVAEYLYSQAGMENGK